MMEDSPFETAQSLHMFLEKFNLAGNVTELKEMLEVGVHKFQNKVLPLSRF